MKDVKEVINPNRTVETIHASQFTSIAMQTRLSDEQ